MYELIIINSFIQTMLTVGISCVNLLKNKTKKILPPANSSYSRKPIMSDGDCGDGDSDGNDDIIVTRA